MEFSENGRYHYYNTQKAFCQTSLFPKSIPANFATAS